MTQRAKKKDGVGRHGKAPLTGRHADLLPWLGSETGFLRRAPVSLWVEDFSEVKLRIDSLRQSGVVSLKRHLNRYPKELLRLTELIRILWANDAALSLYGAGSLSDFRSSLVRVSSKRSYEMFRGQINALAEGRTEFVGESDAVSPRGQTKRILLHVRVDPSHLEDLSSVFVVAVDITGMRHAEEDLRRSEEMYRQAFESAVVPMVILDARTGIVVDSNSSLDQLLGCSSDLVTGKHVAQLCVEGDGKRSMALLARLGGVGASAVETLRLRHDGGREISVVANASVVRAEDGAYVLLSFSSAAAVPPVLNRRTTADRRALSAFRARLTERERMVLALISTGHSNKAIGEQLGISRKTVESHRMRIMQKLDIHKATDLVRFALTSGILVSD